MATRLLKESEVEFARQVFEDELPYGRVYLSNRYFPFNEKTAVTAASAASFLFVRSLRSYTIFVGPEVYDEGADGSFRLTFVHELTHVWQGYHGFLGWAYMAQSMISQGYALLTQHSRHKAYTYKPGAPWESYNVEQQASIVQDWFGDGMKTENDERYHYIANHIRAAGRR